MIWSTRADVIARQRVARMRAQMMRSSAEGNEKKLDGFAASEREFFLTSFDARITFEVDARGRATTLVLNMGTDQRATRVP